MSDVRRHGRMSVSIAQQMAAYNSTDRDRMNESEVAFRTWLALNLETLMPETFAKAFNPVLNPNHSNAARDELRGFLDHHAERLEESAFAEAKLITAP